MEFWLRDGFLKEAPYLLPYLVLVAVLAAAPVMRIGNAWLVERNLDIKFAVPLLFAHFLVMGVAWQLRWLGALVLYLALLTLLMLISPLFNNLNDWLTVRNLNMRDVARFRYMLTLDPNNANALIGLANAYIQIGKPDEAIAAYEKARAIDPQNTSVVNRKLIDLINSRVRRNIGQKGMRATGQNARMLDMEQKVTMEVVDKDDGPSIPEL